MAAPQIQDNVEPIRQNVTRQARPDTIGHRLSPPDLATKQRARISVHDWDGRPARDQRLLAGGQTALPACGDPERRSGTGCPVSRLRLAMAAKLSEIPAARRDRRVQAPAVPHGRDRHSDPVWPVGTMPGRGPPVVQRNPGHPEPADLRAAARAPDATVTRADSAFGAARVLARARQPITSCSSLRAW